MKPKPDSPLFCFLIVVVHGHFNSSELPRGQSAVRSVSHGSGNCWPPSAIKSVFFLGKPSMPSPAPVRFCYSTRRNRHSVVKGTESEIAKEYTQFWIAEDVAMFLRQIDDLNRPASAFRRQTGLFLLNLLAEPTVAICAYEQARSPCPGFRWGVVSELQPLLEQARLASVPWASLCSCCLHGESGVTLSVRYVSCLNI